MHVCLNHIVLMSIAITEQEYEMMLKERVEELLRLLNYRDVTPADQSRVDEINSILVSLDNTMTLYINTHRGDVPVEMYRRMLTFKLNNAIVSEARKTLFYPVTTQAQIALINTTNRSFRGLFGLDLKIPYIRQQPAGHEQEELAPSTFPDAGGPSYFGDPSGKEVPGLQLPDDENDINMHYEVTILNNLHERLIALEQRMGVN